MSHNWLNGVEALAQPVSEGLTQMVCMSLKSPVHNRTAVLQPGPTHYYTLFLRPYGAHSDWRFWYLRDRRYRY